MNPIVMEYQIHNSDPKVGLVAYYRVGFYYANGDTAQAATERNLKLLRETFPDDTFHVVTR